MPDFETRTPPEPSRLSKLRAYAVAAPKRSMASVVAASRRLGATAFGLLRSINRHRWAAGLVAFCVVVLSASIAVYRPELFPEPWPPEYQEITPQDPAACPVVEATCYDVYTNADDEKSLIYVTKAVASGACTFIFFIDQDGNGETLAYGAYIDGRAYVDSADLHIESPYFPQDQDYGDC